MNEVNSIWIAAYDIQNVRCLNKVSRLLLACMQRVQKSVFVGQIDEAMAKSLYNNIIRLIIVEPRVIIDFFKFIIIRTKIYYGVFLYIIICRR